MGVNRYPEPDPGWDQKEHGHWTVWDTALFLELCRYLNYKVIEYQDVDDKVGNGFTGIIYKCNGMLELYTQRFKLEFKKIVASFLK